MQPFTLRMTRAIDAHLDQTIDSNPLFVGAREGMVTPEIVGRYVANVTRLVSYTDVHLERAADVSKARGLHRLAGWFCDKRAEEEGHVEWGEADKQELVDRFRLAVPSRLLPSTRALIGYIRETIDYDPALYLVYILLAEMGAVRVGPVFLGDLEAHCGIPRSAVSILGNHAELDKEHVVDDVDVIDSLLADRANDRESELFSSLQKSMELVDGMHTDIFQLN